MFFLKHNFCILSYHCHEDYVALILILIHSQTLKARKLNLIWGKINSWIKQMNLSLIKLSISHTTILVLQYYTICSPTGQMNEQIFYCCPILHLKQGPNHQNKSTNNQTSFQGSFWIVRKEKWRQELFKARIYKSKVVAASNHNYMKQVSWDCFLLLLHDFCC